MIRRAARVPILSMERTWGDGCKTAPARAARPPIAKPIVRSSNGIQALTSLPAIKMRGLSGAAI
jgi:hypothetical protein